MAEETASPTIRLRERRLALVSAEAQLPKWLTVSFALHALLIAVMFAVSFMPSSPAPAPPVYVVDLIGGERIGRTNFGSEIAPVQNPPTKRAEPEDAALPEPKKEKNEKFKVSEKNKAAEEKLP